MAEFIISKNKVLEQYEKVKNLGCKVSYSKKTNPYVWKILEETDSEVCCHSIPEAKEVKDRSHVWFFTLAIDNEQLDEIFEMGVTKFVVDSPDDLETLLRYIEMDDKKIDLLLRMKVRENTVHTGRYFVFGMSAKIVNDEILELRDNKHIDRLGIHFHRKSQNVSEWSLKDEMSDAILPETLEKIDILDIGGGIPGKYLSSHDASIERVFTKIRELREWLPERILLYAEPGRFIAAPSVKLECKIISIYENNIFVDCSIYNGMLDTIVANVKLIVEGELESGTKYTIKGCTPCSMDIIRYKVCLDDPKVGNKIVFLNAGAYTYTTDFCHLQKIPVRFVE